MIMTHYSSHFSMTPNVDIDFKTQVIPNESSDILFPDYLQCHQQVFIQL